MGSSSFSLNQYSGFVHGSQNCGNVSQCRNHHGSLIHSSSPQTCATSYALNHTWRKNNIFCPWRYYLRKILNIVNWATDGCKKRNNASISIYSNSLRKKILLITMNAMRQNHDNLWPFYVWDKFHDCTLFIQPARVCQNCEFFSTWNDAMICAKRHI